MSKPSTTTSKKETEAPSSKTKKKSEDNDSKIKRTATVKTPDVLVHAVSNLLYPPLRESTNDQVRKFTTTPVFLSATKKLTSEQRSAIFIEEIVRAEDQTLYLAFEELCKKTWFCHNELMCYRLLLRMSDEEKDDYDKYVNSFHEAWEKYLDPRGPGERVNSYCLKTIAALHSVFWDRTKKMPTPLTDEVIVAATLIMSKVDGDDKHFDDM